MESYRKFVQLLFLPIFLKPYFKKDVGREYGVGFFKKLKLLFQMYWVKSKIHCATSPYEYVQMARAILEVPSQVKGAVAECGCWKGGSTASLSLVCALTGRKLLVFDSFQGLPEPQEGDRVHHSPHMNKTIPYVKGDYSSAGLEEVKKNIKKYGCLDVCEFIEGYYEDTMPEFVKGFNDGIVFIFLDVDLRKSAEKCVSHLWPFLQKGCNLFTHEAASLKMASLYFDKEWWAKHLNSSPPCLIGAGSGTCFHPSFGTYIGYAIKPEN